MSALALLNHLRPLPSRIALATALQTNADRVCVYYICPLANLRGIAAEGIHPHESAPVDRTDLSGAGVQALRDKELSLTGWTNRQVHQCINFFWNPLNWTSKAFQHHALLRETASKNSDAGVVCILELDAEQILHDEHHHWTASPVNLASWGYNSFGSSITTGVKTKKNGEPIFDWDGILSIDEHEDSWLNKKRSAELVIFGDIGGQQTSSPLPFDYVQSILLGNGSIRELTPEQRAFLDRTGKPLNWFDEGAAPKVFFPAHRYSEKRAGRLHPVDGLLLGLDDSPPGYARHTMRKFRHYDRGWREDRILRLGPT